LDVTVFLGYHGRNMRSSDSPFVADWFSVSLRWFFLLGVIFSLSIAGKLLILPNVILLGLVGWNIILILMTGLGLRLIFHREISLGVDLLLACAYFSFSGGYANPAFWILFLPLITAALYFEMRGALISAALVCIAQVAVIVFKSPSLFELIILGSSLAATFFIAGLFGYLSVQFLKTNRRVRQSQQDEQDKKQQKDNERLRAVYGLTSTLLSTLNYHRVLESALDISQSFLTMDANTEVDDRLVCAVLLFSKEETLEVGSARRLTPVDMRVVLRGRAGAVAQALDQDKPILLTDIIHDPELTQFAAFQRCTEVYCFPLRSGFNAYGIMLFGHPDSGFFSHEKCEILDILCQQAVIAIQNARLYQDVVDERERMIEVQEEARKKLARDLHDGPTQSVSAIAMRVNMLQRVLAKDPKAASDELSRIEELARRTTKEIRHMLFTLRPLALESQGLVVALSSMAEKMKETYSQNVIISMDEKIIPNLEMGKQGVIFYIVEEAITNARKHANAEHIWVNLRPFDKEIAILEIRDDGVGFDVAAMTRSYDQRGSLGMVNLRERTELVNGILDIQSVIGKGTRVLVYIPQTEEAAERLHHAAAKR
jgi:signal transduction histidine kinase